MGPSREENQSYGGLFGNSGFASNQGMGDISASTDFMKDLLSGDPTKVAQVLAPQIDAITGRAQQQKNNLAEFGNRSGGNNSTASAIDANTGAQVTDLIGNLIGNAANNLMSSGENLLNLGTSGFGNAFSAAKTMQDQNAAKWNDLIGSIAGVAGGVLGALPGAAGGFLDNASNIAAGIS
jgi:hypothetical protein